MTEHMLDLLIDLLVADAAVVLIVCSRHRDRRMRRSVERPRRRPSQGS